MTRSLTPERRGELHQPRQLGTLARPARTAHDRQHQVLGELGIARHRLRERPDRDVGPLVRLEPPDEQREPQAREMEPIARGGAIAWEEDRVVDAGRHDADVLGIRAVQPHELGRLGGGRRQDPVGAGDHALLARETRRRLGCLTPGERVVLDLPQRVERRHERDAQDVLRGASDPPGEPVVAVQDVVAAPVRLGASQDPTQELRQEPRQVDLRHRRARSGLDRDQPHAGRRSPGSPGRRRRDSA